MGFGNLWGGEVNGKQGKHDWDGDEQRQVTGHNELVGEGEISALPLSNDGDSSNGGDCALKKYDHRNGISGADHQQNSQENQRENEVFYYDKFDDLPSLNLAFLFKIHEDIPSEDDHDQGKSHGTDERKLGDDKIGDEALTVDKPYDQGDNGHDKSRVDDTAPVYFFSGPVAEEKTVRTEKKGRVERYE